MILCHENVFKRIMYITGIQYQFNSVRHYRLESLALKKIKKYKVRDVCCLLDCLYNFLAIGFSSIWLNLNGWESLILG